MLVFKKKTTNADIVSAHTNRPKSRSLTDILLLPLSKNDSCFHYKKKNASDLSGKSKSERALASTRRTNDWMRV